MTDVLTELADWLSVIVAIEEAGVLRAMIQLAADVIASCDCEACPLNTSANWGLYCNTDRMQEEQCRVAIVAWLRYWAECKEAEDAI